MDVCVCGGGYHHRYLHEVTESKFKAQKTGINATNDPRKKLSCTREFECQGDFVSPRRRP